MVDAVRRRFPGTTADAVAAAVEAAGLTQRGLARFVVRIEGPAGAEWPRAAMTGKAAYQLAVALHEAGILDRVPPCTHCGRPRKVDSRGPAPPTCAACGPRNADGTKARSTDPEKWTCPAGLHKLPPHTLRCDACADEADTALIQDAILQVGASAGLARTVISDALPIRMSRRRVAEWLRAGGLLDQDDAPPLVQRLRCALAAELPGVSRVRCAGCGRERRVLPHLGENGRICENCYRRTPGRIETCRSCGEERLIPRLRTRGRPGWCFECIARATAAFTKTGEGSAQDPDVDGIRLARLSSSSTVTGSCHSWKPGARPARRLAAP